jgi:hypothetical protein
MSIYDNMVELDSSSFSFTTFGLFRDSLWQTVDDNNYEAFRKQRQNIENFISNYFLNELVVEFSADVSISEVYFMSNRQNRRITIKHEQEDDYKYVPKIYEENAINLLEGTLFEPKIRVYGSKGFALADVAFTYAVIDGIQNIFDEMSAIS